MMFVLLVLLSSWKRLCLQNSPGTKKGLFALMKEALITEEAFEAMLCGKMIPNYLQDKCG